MVLEINATLMENNFEIKEINEEERITFQNGENWRDAHKETKLVGTTETKLGPTQTTNFVCTNLDTYLGRPKSQQFDDWFRRRT